jgi:hypothetical protein
MPRGSASDIGTKTVNKNGYEQTKTEDGWVGSHILIMEAFLGRKLNASERVRFLDGDRSNLTLENLEVVYPQTGSLRRKLAALDERIRELQAQRDYYQQQMDSAEAVSKS